MVQQWHESNFKKEPWRGALGLPLQQRASPRLGLSATTFEGGRLDLNRKEDNTL